MTAEQAKETLPDVWVKLPSGEMVECRTAGCKCRFATLYNPQTGGTWSASWECVAGCVSAGRSILV